MENEILHYLTNIYHCQLLNSFTFCTREGMTEYQYVGVLRESDDAYALYFLLDVDLDGSLSRETESRKASLVPTAYGYFILRQTGNRWVLVRKEYGKDEAQSIVINPDDLSSLGILKINDFRQTTGNSNRPMLPNDVRKYYSRSCKRIYNSLRAGARGIGDGASVLFKSGLFDYRKTETLFRYMSVDAFCRKMTNEDWLQKMQLSSLCSMNDCWEYSYAYDENNCCVILSGSEVLDTYIISLSQVHPEKSLDMWRFYGDEGRGVCLQFEVERHEHIFKVKYVQDYTGFPNLPINHKGCNYYLQLKDKRRRYSLKPIDYAAEKEVRVIIMDSIARQNMNSWINAHGVLNPITFKPIDEIGLKLKKIILGPNHNEKIVNLQSIKSLLSAHNITDVSVEKLDDRGYKP